MKRIVGWSFALLLAVVFGMGAVSLPRLSAVATEANKEITILDNDFASSDERLSKHGILKNQVSNITPVSPSGYQRFE